MKKRRSISSRALFTIVSIVTLILLLGSAFLQRTIFKAEQQSASLFLSPAQATAKPGATVGFALRANLSGVTTVTAAEFALKYDPKVLQFVQADPANGWQTVKVLNDDGLIQWAVTPLKSLGVAVDITSQSTFGTVSFITKASGVAQLALDLARSSIASVDATQSPSLYNAVTSVQDASISIADNATTTPLPTTSPDAPTPAGMTGTLQKITAIQELVGSESAVLLVSTEYPATLLLRFGSDQNNLTNTVQTNSALSNSVLHLNGLDPATSYYYQLTLVDQVTNAKIISKERSLTTGAVSSTSSLPAQLQLYAFPAIAQKQTTLYIRATDQTGAVVTDQKPVITIGSGRATTSIVSGSDGLYQTTVDSELTSQQSVTIQAAVGAVNATTKLTFDPNFQPAERPPVQLNPALSLNLTVVTVLIGLLLVLGGLLLIFVRLARG